MSHPHQQRPQYPQYGPPPPPPGYGYAPPVPRRRGPRWGLRITFVLLLVGALFGYFFFIHGGHPQEGDCLKNLDESFTGWSTVECSDPAAAWKVVETATGGGYDSDLGTCAGHPEGQQVNKRNGKRGRRWEMCVVPVTAAK